MNASMYNIFVLHVMRKLYKTNSIKVVLLRWLATLSTKIETLDLDTRFFMGNLKLLAHMHLMYLIFIELLSQSSEFFCKMIQLPLLWQQ